MLIYCFKRLFMLSRGNLPLTIVVCKLSLKTKAQNAESPATLGLRGFQKVFYVPRWLLSAGTGASQ
jgi:hypothetical protein